MTHAHAARLASLTALAAAISFASSASAQEHVAVTQQYQTWIAMNYQGPVAGRWQLAGDVQYRAWDDLTPQAVIVRNALLYRIIDGMFAGLGYMWQPAWRARGFGGLVDEHRIFQTFQYQFPIGSTGVTLQLRTRFEERFRHPQDEVEIGFRFRQLARFTVPIALQRRLAIIAWDEIFFDLDDSGHEPSGVNATGAQTFTPQWQYLGFDQNRAFIGLSYQFVPGVLRAEVGYMNQYVRRPNNPNNGGDLMGNTTLLQVYANWR